MKFEQKPLAGREGFPKARHPAWKLINKRVQMSQDQLALLFLRLLRDSSEQPVIKRGGACVWQQRALVWAEVRESGKPIMGSVSPAIVTFGGETLPSLPVASRGATAAAFIRANFLPIPKFCTIQSVYFSMSLFPALSLDSSASTP